MKNDGKPMLMSVDCIPCFVKQAFREINGSEMKKDTKEDAWREILKMISEYDYDVSPVDVAFEIHQMILAKGGKQDPYERLKDRSNDAAREHLDEVAEKIANSEDRLRESLMAAVAGNVIDYGAKNLLDLSDMMKRAEVSGFRIDDYGIFIEKLTEFDRILYLLDNSGEILLDSLLMKEILKLYPGKRIEAVVKKSPILNDVTIHDARYAGIDSIDGVEILELPEQGWVKPDFVEEHTADHMVISKGQGNFESLSGMNGLFFLLVVKCEHVADVLSVDVGDMILKYS